MLDGTYHDKNGNEFTGEDAFLKGLIANLADPKGKNWGKAVDTLIQLTGANKSQAENKLLKAQAAMIQAKVDLLTGSDTTTLDKLDSILQELKDDALKDGDL